MDPFADRDISDCLADPAFYKTLLMYGGNSSEEAAKIMADIQAKNRK